jgi:oligoendopeptidase F
VEKAVVPFVSELNAHRKQVLGINTLRPWDKGVDLDGKILRPFKDSNELIDKSLDILYRVKPSFAMQVAKMRNSGYSTWTTARARPGWVQTTASRKRPPRSSS